MSRCRRPRLPRSSADSVVLSVPVCSIIALLVLGVAVLPPGPAGASSEPAPEVASGITWSTTPTLVSVTVELPTQFAPPIPAPPPVPPRPPARPAPPAPFSPGVPAAAEPLSPFQPEPPPPVLPPPAPQARPASPPPTGLPSAGMPSAGPLGTDPATLSHGPPRHLRIYLTGYSFHDNTPPLSAIISAPVLHRTAGGQGTYQDPITVAVPGTATTMTWKPGTRFYLPSVRRYVIVEDSGASPAPPGVDTHLDMWIGGQGGTRGATDDCMSKLTGTVPAVLNPPPGLSVMVGPIFGNRACRVPLLNLLPGGAGGRPADPNPG